MYTPKGEINDALYEAMKNPDVVSKLAEAKTPEDCYEIVKAAGVDVAMDDFQKSMEIMNSYLEESQEGVLSEEDLDQVAGGKSDSSRQKVDDATKGLELAGAAVGVVGAIAGAAAAAA